MVKGRWPLALMLAAAAHCTRPGFAAEATGPLLLRSETLDVAVSRATGAVAGIRDRRLGRRAIVDTDDCYRVEDRQGRSESGERHDRVTSFEQRDATELTLVCTNALLPDLLIRKTYRFGDCPSELARTTRFRSRSDGGYFLSYFVQTALDPAFRAGGRFDLHAADYLGPGEPALEHRGHNRVVVQYRYRVNDRFVTTVTGFPFSDGDRYTDCGWFDPVFADYLGENSEASAEVRTLVLEGDEFDYYAYYDHLPEVEKVYDVQVPQWLWEECRMDAMYMSRNNPADLAGLACMTTRWDLNKLWGDYFSTGDLVVGSRDTPRPTIPAEKVARENRGLTAAAPHWRLAMYTWLWTIAAETKALAEHPEFTVTGRDGKPERCTVWNHDVTGLPSYYRQVRAPGFVEYFTGQYRDYARRLGVHFVYIDGCPTGISRPDWKLHTVQQTYDWIDYFRRVREAIREERPGEGFVFVNNPNMPHTDGGYLEDHEMAKHIREDWRAYAHRLMVMKYRERPRRWHALLYWMEANKPYYSNYALGMGFTYSNGGTEWHADKLRAYVDAGWELRGSRMVMAVDTPRFWREPTDFEVYALRKGSEGLVSIISHAAGETRVPVRLDAAAMGLDPDRPVHAWQLRMRDTRPAKEWEHAPRQCFDKVYLGTREVRAGKLRLDVAARPLLLELIVLTQTPLWFSEVNGEVLRTVQNNLLTASIDEADAEGRTHRVTAKQGPATLFVVAGSPAPPAVFLDGEPCPLAAAELGNANGFTFPVPQGSHIVELR